MAKPRKQARKPRSVAPGAGALTGGTLGARIYEARKRAGLTKTDLANLCEVTWHMVHWWEQDKHVPGGDHIRRIAEVTGVNVDELLGLMDGQEPTNDGWRAFKETPTYAELSEQARRALRIFPWPTESTPTLESYRWLVEALKSARV